MFPAWLLGVAAYHLCAARRLSPAVGWFLLTVPLVLLAGYQMIPPSPFAQFMPVSLDIDRLESTGRDCFIAAAFAVHLIGFTVVSETFAPWLELHARRIRWIAGATFSVYLAHLPLMHLLSAVSPWPKSSPWTLLMLLTLTPAACFAFAEISERRKDAWRVLIESVLDKLESCLRAGLRKLTALRGQG